MGYIAKERIYLNEAGQPCEPDDPRVAQMLVAPGQTLKDTVVARYGLEKDARLLALPGAAPAGTRERGSDYYELTGGERPVAKGQEPAPGEEPPAPTEPAPEASAEPATATEPAEAPAKAKAAK